MSLPDTIKLIQGELGAERDGVFGPVTAAAVLLALHQRNLANPADSLAPKTPLTPATLLFDDRSEATLATLDPRAQPLFREFLCLAKATAATFGCDYCLISGYRSWEEQAALYAQGRTAPGPRVTHAGPGYSFHNFKVAADAGVFSGKMYLDGGNAWQQAKASQVHAACAHHAEACGLLCGATWSSLPDEPHYQVDTGTDSPTDADRATFLEKGSIL